MKLIKILVLFTVNQDYQSFAVSQFVSLSKFYNIQLFNFHSSYHFQEQQSQFTLTHQDFQFFPFLQLQVESKHVKTLKDLVQRSILINRITIIYNKGKSYQELVKFDINQIQQEFGSNQDTQFRCNFFSRNKTVSFKQKKQKIHFILDHFQIQGKINLNNPTLQYSLLQNHKWNIHNNQLSDHQSLINIYFGLDIANLRIKGKKLLYKYSLTNRIYLGPTSTDHQLAFLMVNQAHIKQGDIVYDPFVGTGSILIAAAHYGAHCIGSDLDKRVLIGKGVGRLNRKSLYFKKQLWKYYPKIYLNFKQYGFELPELFQQDCLQLQLGRQNFIDAIVCDPPYGMRAMSRTIKNQDENFDQKIIQKTKSQKLKQNQIQLSQQIKKNIEKTKKWKEEIKLKRKQKSKIQKQEQLQQSNREIINQQQLTHEKIDYQIIYKNLIRIAQKSLKNKGRLVFLYPDFEDKKLEIPIHNNLKLISVTQNKLTGGCKRLCITMIKMLK